MVRLFDLFPKFGESWGIPFLARKILNLPKNEGILFLIIILYGIL